MSRSLYHYVDPTNKAYGRSIQKVSSLITVYNVWYVSHILLSPDLQCVHWSRYRLHVISIASIVRKARAKEW